MNAQIFEFRPQGNKSSKETNKDEPKKSNTIPLGLAKLESMDDSVTDDIVRKVGEFAKFKFKPNQKIYLRYVEEVEKFSLDEVIEVCKNMTDQDMQNNPNYTKALFYVFQRKLAEVNKKNNTISFSKGPKDQV